MGVVSSTPSRTRSSPSPPQQPPRRSEGRHCSWAQDASFRTGGQGSTYVSPEVEVDIEWGRVGGLIPAFLEFDLPVSIGTWHSVNRGTVEAGGHQQNAFGGLPIIETIKLAAEFTRLVLSPVVTDQLFTRFATSEPASITSAGGRRRERQRVRGRAHRR